MAEKEGRRLPIRTTRGQRLTKVVDEELEADEAFWNQDALKDDGTDDGYETEEEVNDEFDSDFNDSEPEADDDAPGEMEKFIKEKKSKLRINVLQAQPNKRKKTDATPKGRGVGRGADRSQQGGRRKRKKSKADDGEVAAATIIAMAEPPPEEEEADEDEAEGKEGKSSSKSRDRVAMASSNSKWGDGLRGGVEEKMTRKSSRTAVVVKAAERERERARAKVMAPVRRRKEAAVDDRKMTQEEMLHEAAQTEIMNLQSLEIMLAREEEVKKRAIVQKETYSGPLIRFYSRDGINILEFTKIDKFPKEIHSKAAPYPQPAVCMITGLPARYRDPETGLPYATKEAFRVLRERFSQGKILINNNDVLIGGSTGGVGEGRRQAEGVRESTSSVKRRAKADRGEQQQSSSKTKQSKLRQQASGMSAIKFSASGADKSIIIATASQSAAPPPPLFTSPIVPTHITFGSSSPIDPLITPSPSPPQQTITTAIAAQLAIGGQEGVIAGGNAEQSPSQISRRTDNGNRRITINDGLLFDQVKGASWIPPPDSSTTAIPSCWQLGTPKAVIAAPGTHFLPEGAAAAAMVPTNQANVDGEGFISTMIGPCSSLERLVIDNNGDGDRGGRIVQDGMRRMQSVQGASCGAFVED